MRKNERWIDESELLPFHIIQAASEGDVEAINVVLKHYEGYHVFSHGSSWIPNYVCMAFVKKSSAC